MADMIDTDYVTDTVQGDDYRYDFGLANHMEDPGYSEQEVPNGGDIRLRTEGWFSNLPDFASSPYPVSTEYYVEPKYDGQVEINGLNPEDASSPPISGPSIGIGYGVGPWQATALSWNVGTDPDVVENYNGYDEHTFWNLYAEDWPDDQDDEQAMGTDWDLTVDPTLDNYTTFDVYVSSNFTFEWTETLTGNTYSHTTDDATLEKPFTVMPIE